MGGVFGGPIHNRGTAFHTRAAAIVTVVWELVEGGTGLHSSVIDVKPAIKKFLISFPEFNANQVVSLIACQHLCVRVIAVDSEGVLAAMNPR